MPGPGRIKLRYKHRIWPGSKRPEGREEGSPEYQAAVSEGGLLLSITRGIKSPDQRSR